jgi:hypothetical protein
MLAIAAVIGQYRAVSEEWIYVGTTLFAATFLLAAFVKVGASDA